MEICNRFFNKDMVKIFRGCILAALFFCPYLKPDTASIEIPPYAFPIA